jgi:bifunctional DNA-binding transcriptional regulator/antitoxin component of YhaV-PrlF toxin-antitoxin module
MAKSTITGKYKTTVPKEILQKLNARPGDVLLWEVVGDHVRVTAAPPAFLSLQGTFKVGPGDPVEDVRRARELIGLKGL